MVNANTNSATSGITSAVNAHTDIASTSLASVINANTNAQTSGITSAVNNNTNATVLAASSSLALAITNIPATVWGYTTRTLTTFGSLATDVWNATTRTLTSLTLSSTNPWTVSLSDSNTVAAGNTYRVTVTTILSGTLTDSANLPTITIYDPSRNVIVNGSTMTRTGTGTYEYSYVTNGASPAGVWQTAVSATVESSKTLPGISYWNLTTSPAQVIVRDVTGTTVPNISADVTITNEGDAGYEYHYAWCVVASPTATCDGGSSNLFYATAAKYINPGENFNTTLTANVANPGNYYFKVIAYFGTQASGASRSFTAVSGNNNNNGNSGGSTGGPLPPPTLPPISFGSCKGADLNGDNKVNTVDFSILLSFWKKPPPFKNACVDINHDKKVNAQDFSIMLSQWGTNGRALPAP
jgi:hypothetical protein